jgi:hypothetical protein
MSNDLKMLWVVVPGSIGNVTTVSSLSWAAAGVTDASSHGASRPPRQIVNLKFLDIGIMTSPYVYARGELSQLNMPQAPFIIENHLARPLSFVTFHKLHEAARGLCRDRPCLAL